jgi:sterol 3beta-glucosyltransferase
VTLRVGIQGWGSEGDLRPLLALAARLRQRGHSVRVVFTPVDGKDYAPLCQAIDVPLQLVPERPLVTLQQLVREAKSKDPTKLMNAVLDLTFYPYLEAIYAAALRLCEQCDVIIGGSSAWPTKAAAQKAGTTFVAVHYYPGVVPTRSAPPAIFPPWRWLTRPGWALLRLLMDAAFREPARKFFAAKGLPRIHHAIPDVLFSERLNLLAASPGFWPPAADWTDCFCVTGEFRVPDGTDGWQPSAELARYLDVGPKPALLSLGSMEHMAPERVRTLLVDAARSAGVRAIIQSKAGAEEGCDGALYFLPWAPHAWLLPRCSLAVHHGGAGTTHAALRAGLPSLVLPFIFEQGLWAKRLEQVGAARATRSFWKANANQVGARIRALAGAEDVAAAARRIGAVMAREDGCAVAAERIERLFEN